MVLVDDDDAKVRRRLHGLIVAGTIDEIPQVAASYGVGEIVIAIPTATGQQMERIVKRCEESGVRFRIQPADGDSISLARLRDVEITDLLGRPSARLDVERIREDISGRRVLITGAAGSIGSELVRQCASYGPSRLTLLDRNENGLFYLEREMLDRYPDLSPEVIVGDLLDPGTLVRAFPEDAPDYVFHAAAFKHVPLMEANPEEAVKNNVLGTLRVAVASRDAGVRKFVLISTDKAVRPSSVMGATKRAAELLCQAIDSGTTIFTAVRFGNVLGSQGSIVPLFSR